MDYKLFRPSNQDMLKEFPELSEYKEFTNLSKEDLRFVYYYANKTSEFENLKDNARLKAAYEQVFGARDDQSRIHYLAGNYSEQVRSAIDRMRLFNPSARMRAKLMLEKTYSQFEDIMHSEPPKADDQDAMRKFVEMKLKMTEYLPDLIKQMERGYGITEVEELKDPDKRHASFMDKIHDHNQIQKN